MEGPGPDDEMFCPFCGERIHRTARFCRHCGEQNTKHPEYTGANGGERQDRRNERYEESTAPETGQGEQRGPDTGQRDHRGPETGQRDHREPGTGRRDEAERETGRHADEAPEPWETDYARRVESRIDDGNGDASDGTLPQWRAYLPDQTADESTLRVVGTAASLGIAGVVLLVIVTLLSVRFGTSLGFSFTAMGLLGTLLGQYIGFAGLALWYLHRRGFDWDRMRGYLGVRMPSLKELGLVVGSWLVILGLLIVIGLTLEFVTDLLGTGEPDEPERALDSIIADNPIVVPAAILAMFLVVGPCEELLFRGVVQGRLRERLSAIPAIVIASALFAAVHVIALAGSLQAIMLGISVLFVTSLVIGAVYEYTGSVVVASLLHGFHNSMVVLLLYVEATTDLEEGMVVLLSLL